MAGKLTVLGLKALVKPGRYVDGDGLHLHVRGPERRAWVFRYTRQGKTKDMGLGSYPEVSLSSARGAAADANAVLRAKADPLQARQATATPLSSRTFREAATDYLAAHSPSWRNPKHVAQWEATLKAHAYPAIGDFLVSNIDVDAVLNVLKPIWAKTPETASRLRGRIEAILDAAKGRGWRHGENPARWKGNLSGLLPPKGRMARVEHQPSLPWEQMPAFMQALRAQAGTGAAALELAILTAARTGEVRGMRWQEIDLEEGIWLVPAERMKAGRMHRVPLVGRSLEILQRLAPTMRERDSLVFPGSKGVVPLSDMALSMVVRRMNGETKPPTWRDISGRAVVPHGFRSSFRVWAGEMTAYPREVVEASLAHTLKDKTEAAYARTDLMERRRPLMKEWGEWCGRA
ncbi:tyrosine-type recombinase/integrase [Acidisoma cladoniae]|jgi:integrase|uniref:tyrosine-type recombinase/integrase n=1 Tax=Acidisoma cladoniae TaxID=3040935 RepID=UPI00254EDB7B|nr:site-specific integrase [Acidisoma sp. PAMC 29798]